MKFCGGCESLLYKLTDKKSVLAGILLFLIFPLTAQVIAQ